MRCFFAYFSPLIFHIRDLISLSVNDLVGVGALIVTAIATGALGVVGYFLDLNYFGVSNLLVIMVILTIAGNTFFGVLKSKKKAREALFKANEMKPGPEQRLQLKLHKRYEFDYNKLQFVFFKTLAFLAYLSFASTFLRERDGFLDWTSAVVIQTPVAIMWYKEWKSIGDNSEYLYDKKAGIFEVTEFIFEMKFFSEYFNKDKPPKTPEA